MLFMRERSTFISASPAACDATGEGFGVDAEIRISQLSPTDLQQDSTTTEESMDVDIMRWESEGGIVIYEKQPVSARKDNKNHYTAAEYAEIARRAYLSNPYRVDLRELSDLGSNFGPLKD
jgi:hypothetical protein